MNFNEQQNSGVNSIKKTIDDLSKLSDEELVAELNKQLKLKQENGSLKDLEKLVRAIAPFLSPEQKTRLANIIKTMQNK